MLIRVASRTYLVVTNVACHLLWLSLNDCNILIRFVPKKEKEKYCNILMWVNDE
jgi:hypothetical protein